MPEVLLLKDCLLQNFQLNTRIYTSSGDPHQIWVEPNDYAIFYNHVFPYINDFQTQYPKYMLNNVMKNKVIFDPKIVAQGLAVKPVKIPFNKDRYLLP